ncbi:MAG: DUF1598 domain-containing protein [Pirellulales bacterium]|nr:DUF1598 domain-containing protein [Pirellulales bacterium]
MRERQFGPIFGAIASMLALLVFFSGPAVNSPLVGADRPPAVTSSGDTIADHLAAGEFSLALAQARKISSPSERDAAITRIATAQAAAGGRNAAIGTAFELSSDIVRVQMLREIGPSRPAHYLPVETATEINNNDAAGNTGGAEADFDALIDLITNTVAPDTWKINGGQGDVQGFEGGVYCDPTGLLVRRTTLDDTAQLAALQQKIQTENQQPRGTIEQPSALRKISLVRLEAAVQRALAEGRPLTDDLRYLAGLERIQYIFVYPQQRDIVIAGPAAGWRRDPEGRCLSTRTGAPVLHLDDLVVILRHMLSQENAIFGCSITPTKERLAATQEFLTASTQKPLPPGKQARDAWVEQIRQQLGRQKIEIYGLDPRTRAARVLVEADYRMKLVGIGLEPGVLGVTNYLDAIRVAPGESAPPLEVLRWWFAVNYQKVVRSVDGQAFAIRGQGVQVLSENELLDPDGTRQHTGNATDQNRQFTSSFTAKFEQLAQKYPVYADLRNLFDLALLGAIVQQHDLDQRAEWHMTCFGAEGSYQPQRDVAPAWVESVVNHRVVNKKQVIVGISGGVRVDLAKLADPDNLFTETKGFLHNEHKYHGHTRPQAAASWWWD